MTDSAFDIYQRNCDSVARAVWDRDFALALKHLSLPNRMVSPDADVTLEDETSLEQALSELREALARLGATAFVRICKTADFAPGDDNTIFGSHVTHVLRGGTNVLPPYDSRMLMRRGPEGWKAADIFSHVSNRHMTVISPEMVRHHRTRTE